MIELNEAQELIRRTVRGFAEAEIEPIADEIDREDKWPGHLWPMLGELGLLGVTIDERYGGSDAGLLAGVIATEEIARASASVALSYGAHANLCANNIATNGSEAQKRRYLPGLCSGAEVGALALTEPEAGSDAVGIRSTAAREGDVYRLNGSKMFITNGSVADTLVLYAKTDPEAGSRGITAFIVESSFEGFSVGQKLDKVGHRGSPTAELLLEDCLVPADNVLGREGGGAAVMMQGLAVERAFLAGEPLGIAQAALDAAVGYARERRQFGQRIGDFPADSGDAGGHVHGVGGCALAGLPHSVGSGGTGGAGGAGEQGGGSGDSVFGGDVESGGRQGGCRFTAATAT